MGGELIIAVLSEAVKKFGRIDATNKLQVADWVQRRVTQIQAGQGEIQPYRPQGFDVTRRKDLE
jgi:hypothetical protein